MIICAGEVKIYVGGRMELYVRDEVFVPVWISGRVLAKARYQNRGERSKIINKARELFGEIEVGIMPDIVSGDERRNNT